MTTDQLFDLATVAAWPVGTTIPAETRVVLVKPSAIRRLVELPLATEPTGRAARPTIREVGP